MRDVWQFVKKRRDSDVPRQMSAYDFKVPLRDAVALWLERWGPLLVFVATIVAVVAGYLWLS